MKSNFVALYLNESYISSLAEIEKRCFGEDAWAPSMFEGFFKNPFCKVVGLTDDGKIISYLIFYEIDSEVEILNFAVDVPYQRQGIGDEFMKYIFSNIVSEKASTFYLDVRESNFKAIGLYKKNGFVQYGIRKNYYNNPRENAILMVKNR